MDRNLNPKQRPTILLFFFDSASISSPQHHVLMFFLPGSGKRLSGEGSTTCSRLSRRTCQAHRTALLGSDPGHLSLRTSMESCTRTRRLRAGPWEHHPVPPDFSEQQTAEGDEHRRGLPALACCVAKASAGCAIEAPRLQRRGQENQQSQHGLRPRSQALGGCLSTPQKPIFPGASCKDRR